MKKTFIQTICVLFCQCSILAQTDYIRQLKKGECVVFGDRVNMYNAYIKVVNTLNIASKIEVIEKTSIKQKFGKIEDYWYKVKYKNTEGYIWGGLIADHFLEADFDTNGTQEIFMISNLTIDPNLGSNDYNVWKFRIAENNKLVSELIKVTPYRIDIDTIIIDYWNKFNPTIRVLGISYEFNGETGGNAELFLNCNNNILRSLFTISYNKGEGGYGCSAEAIFPENKKGKPNTVIIKETCGGEGMSSKYFKRELIWDGEKFTQKK